MKEGKVYLVGAGSGDPGLITQKGLECLAQADVVIYDHLLDERLLESAPPAAERIYVGKKVGEHAREQDEINQLLVEVAKDGKTVVRLKGGDPFVLGRGGEEAEFLRDNNIPFEIVPGVTSAIAIPAYAGIPVTHRGMASSFAVITGHEDPKKFSSSIAWGKLATGVDTLVFLMGMHNLPKIVAKLLEHSRPPDTPVAVIKNGSTPEQKTVTGTLQDIVSKAEEHSLEPPVVIVVGEVVRLREKLRWFDNLPLFGKRVLVTRARHQANLLSKFLSERGAQPIELPVIDIQAIGDTKELDRAITDLRQYHWILFTSVNGVEAFFKRLYDLNLDARALKNVKIGVIGPATAEVLRRRGIIPDYIPEVFTGEGIVAGLNGMDIAGKRFLLPRTDLANKELTKDLIQLGAEVHDIVTYRTVPSTDSIFRAKEMLLSGKIDILTFTSSSTVSNIVAAFSKDLPTVNRTKVACIGPKTADAAAKAGLKVDIVAKKHTIPGLVAAIEKYFKEET
ncbi:MAG: uroporphyrinogen-III C-methyltransferase [Actinobacteria bacterium]|nr:uroporphyrinogen-III C-methyltransferase [Actinomycetota bacterium]